MICPENQSGEADSSRCFPGTLLKTQIEQIIDYGDGTTTQQLDTIAENMDDHIRFEERILFPYMDVTLTKEELESIGRSLMADKKRFA